MPPRLLNRASPLVAKLILLLLFLAAIAFAGWISPKAPAGAAQLVRTATSTSFYATPFERQPRPQTLTDVGRALFFDPALSASGTMSCASCHDPAHAFAPANDQAVQRGGPSGTLAGIRAVPSLRYRQDIPPFSEHFNDNDGNDSEDQGPTGGLDWDGRAASGHEQAAGPLLSPFEMANADSDAVVARLRSSGSAALLRSAFGEHLFDHPQLAWNAVVLSLEVFQQSPTEFYPYDSKYDQFLRGQATLTAAETRGLHVFNDADKGNCALCHPSALKRGAFPPFTDNGFIALGVPRNPSIPANASAAHVDLGLCGPLRTDLKDRREYCGLFRTPSLRNVATRQVFFHNGVVRRLEEAVRFYAQRDTNPQRFYPRGVDGQVRKYDDLPADLKGNVNHEAPFGLKPGGKPALSEAEIADVVAFLKTLTDGDGRDQRLTADRAPLSGHPSAASRPPSAPGRAS